MVNNKESIKKLSNALIDCEYAFQDIKKYGTPVLNFTGEKTPQYIEMCNYLNKSCEDVIVSIQELKTVLPTPQ